MTSPIVHFMLSVQWTQQELYIRFCPRKWLGVESHLGNPQPAANQCEEFPMMVGHRNHGKVKFSCPATCHGGTCGERSFSSYSYLTLALDVVSGQRHSPVALYPRGKDPLYPLDRGGWVGPRAGLDAGARRKILCLCRGSNPDHSQTLYCLSYRNHDNEGKHGTMVTMPKATKFDKVTKINNHTSLCDCI
jgi:hypothetical protein